MFAILAFPMCIRENFGLGGGVGVTGNYAVIVVHWSRSGGLSGVAAVDIVVVVVSCRMVGDEYADVRVGPAARNVDSNFHLSSSPNETASAVVDVLLFCPSVSQTLRGEKLELSFC